MMLNTTIDLVGQKFSRLTVLSRLGSNTHRVALWLCECECGNKKSYKGADLRSGHTRSCGCLKAEETIARSTTHGCSPRGRVTVEHNSWSLMKGRCLNPNNEGYSDYGGRGIKVCERWIESFENFLTDMGKRPTPKHSIDRINNNGNYEPSNCRWATPTTQAQNRRVRRWHKKPA